MPPRIPTKSDFNTIVLGLPYLIVLALADVATSLLAYVQDDTVVSPDGSTYDQAVWQTLVIFIGEALCFPIYWALRSYVRSKSRRHYEKTPDAPFEMNKHTEILLSYKDSDIKPIMSGWNNFRFVGAAALDVTGTVINYIAYKYTTPSANALINSTQVIITAFLDIILLKARIPTHRWIAMAVLFIGVLEVSWSSNAFSGDDGTDTTTTVFGVIMTIISTVLPSLQTIYEESLFTSFAVSPAKAVGIEGVGGVVICVILVPILGAILPSDSSFGHYFDYKVGFEQSFVKFWPILWTNIVEILVLPFMNLAALAQTTLLNANIRVSMNTCSIVLVWIFSVIFGLETFIWQQIPGFVLVTLGIFMYGDFIFVPKSFREQAARESAEAEALQKSLDAEEALKKKEEASGHSAAPTTGGSQSRVANAYAA